MNYFEFLVPKILINTFISILILFIFDYLTSFLSGWFKLAKNYHTQAIPDILFRWQSGNIGSVFYRNNLNIGVCEQGLYLSVTISNPFAHPSILIPWDAIDKIDKDSFNDYKIQICNPASIIRLPQKSLDSVKTIISQKIDYR